MIDVLQLKLSLDAALPENTAQANQEIADQLDIDACNIKRALLIKRSVDARKKSDIHFVATYRLSLDHALEQKLLDKRFKHLQIKKAKPYEPLVIPDRSLGNKPAPVVVGTGPAGLFAAWYLAKAGLCPIVIEQGANLEERLGDVDRFVAAGKLDPYSNIQFGEGGAGTFSDGKLSTNSKNPLTEHVLNWFVEAGAPEQILWQAHPHLGSDKLVSLVRAIRQDIQRLGGCVYFHTRLTGLSFTSGKLSEIQITHIPTGQHDSLKVSELIIACGHSARDTFELLRDSGFAMEQKPFSVGVRVEHPQELINKAQWGSAHPHPALGAAEYKAAVHLDSGRHVYTFCMCPGGEVVAAASEDGGIVTNGMSVFARDGKYANAALLVNVGPNDFPSDDVLSGIAFQRDLEQRAYCLSLSRGGAPYQAPAQRLGDFLEKKTRPEKKSEREADRPDLFSTYPRGVVEAPIDEIFPPWVSDSLREALPLIARKIKGFDDPDSVMIAPETRSSSPVRVCRDEYYQAFFANTSGVVSTSEGIFEAKACLESEAESQESQEGPRTGVYPCGEGPGFAGGIMSAGVDGLRVAIELAKTYPKTKRSDKTKKGDPSLSQKKLDEAVLWLKQGNALVFPTDTVYGLGISPFASSSPQLLYDLKGRPATRPIAWLIDSFETFERLASFDNETSRKVAMSLARAFWPGALTLIVDCSREVPTSFSALRDIACVSSDTSSAAFESVSHSTLGFRIPNHPIALELIKAVGGALVTTSANRSGGSDATNADQLDEDLCKQAGLVLLDDGEEKADNGVKAHGNVEIHDGKVKTHESSQIQGSAQIHGSFQPHESSTVVRIGANSLKLLREGPISRRQLNSVLIEQGLSKWMLS